jgi:hypothetical protein
MDGQTATFRTLTPAERAAVGGGFDYNEFLGSVAVGAFYGAPAGAVLLSPMSPYFGAAMGAFIGGFFGAGYYVGGELIDYCF